MFVHLYMALQPSLAVLPPSAQILSSRLAVLIDEEQLVAYSGSDPIFQCALDDHDGLRLAAGMFSHLRLAGIGALAQALDVNRETVRRNRDLFAQGGVDAVRSRTGGPRQPYKLKEAARQAAQRCLDQGWSVNRTAKEVGLTEGTLRYQLRQGRLRRDAGPSAAPTRCAPSPAAEAMSSPSSRTQEDQTCQQGVAVKRTVERERGVVGLVGAARAGAHRGRAGGVWRLARRLLRAALGAVDAGLHGPFAHQVSGATGRALSGRPCAPVSRSHAPAAQAPCATPRPADAGDADFYVNDAGAELLFVVTAAATEGLLTMLDQQLLPQVRCLVGPRRRVTLVFDREGWSPKSFARWKDEHFDVITYRKGEQSRWQKRFFSPLTRTVDGRKVVYQLAERQVKLNNGLSVREVRRLTDDGHQTAVITTNARLSMFQIAHRMFSRWRQENFFRYMRHEFALEQQIRTAQTALGQLVGRRVLLTPGETLRVKGRILDEDQVDELLRQREGDIERLKARRDALPTQVPLDHIIDAEHIVQLERERKLLTRGAQTPPNRLSGHRGSAPRSGPHRPLPWPVEPTGHPGPRRPV